MGLHNQTCRLRVEVKSGTNFDRFKYLQYCVDKAAFPTSCSLLRRCLYVARRASWLILEHLVASPVSDITPNSPLPFLFSIGKLEPSLSTLYIIQCFASFEISSHKSFYVQKNVIFVTVSMVYIFQHVFIVIDTEFNKRPSSEQQFIFVKSCDMSTIQIVSCKSNLQFDCDCHRTMFTLSIVKPKPQYHSGQSQRTWQSNEPIKTRRKYMLQTRTQRGKT